MPKDTVYYVYEKPNGGCFVSVQEKKCCKLIKQFADRSKAQEYVKIEETNQNNRMGNE